MILAQATFSNVFSTLGKSLENGANSFIASKVGAVIGVAAPIALAGVSLYLVIYGYMIITGRVQQPFYDFAIKCVKIIIVAAFSVAGSYGELSSAIEGLQKDLVSALGGSTTIYGALDSAADQGLELLRKIHELNAALDFYELSESIGYWLMFAIVAAAYLLILVGIAATIMISMIFLKILLALGPIFVMCLMFPPVSRFFDNWFGAVMSNVFVTVIGSAFAVIAIKILSAASGVMDLTSSTINPWSTIIGLCVISIVLFIATRSIASLAAGLGGGVASEAISAGHALGSALGLNPTTRQVENIKRGYKGAKNMANWASSRIRSANTLKNTLPAKPAYNRTQKYN